MSTCYEHLPPCYMWPGQGTEVGTESHLIRSEYCDADPIMLHSVQCCGGGGDILARAGQVTCNDPANVETRVTPGNFLTSHHHQPAA